MPLYGVIGRIGKSGAFLALCPSTITLVYIPPIDRHKYTKCSLPRPFGSPGTSCFTFSHNVTSTSNNLILKHGHRGPLNPS